MPDAKPSRTYTMADWLKQASERTKPYLAFQATTRAEWEVWRHSLQTRLWQLMGPFPYRVALDPEVLERTPCDGYVREKVVFNSEDAASVPAWVLVPNQRPASGKFRTLLCLHGHNGGRAFGKDGPAGVTGDNPDKQKVITNDNYDYAVQFAKHGYLTIAPDSRGFGERFDAKPTYGHRDPCNVNFLATSLLGHNLLALNLLDYIATVDYLLTRPDVDADRIGCMGLSFGGTGTMWLAALDERVKVACISGYLTSFKKYGIEMDNFCGSQYLPWLLRYADIPDLCGLIAPRPLLIEHGVEDKGFPIETTREAFAQLKKVYEIIGEPQKVDMDEFQGGHRFSGRKAFDWFDKWLA